MKVFLLALMLLCSTAYAQEIPLGDYYVFIDTEVGKEGVVLRICHVDECTPNENELRNFRVIKLTFTSEQQFYDFSNSLMEPEVDVNGNQVFDGKIRQNKIDITNIIGKKEKLNVQDITIISTNSTDKHKNN